MLHLKSSLQGLLDTQKTYILNVREMNALNEQNFATFILFFNSIILMLSVLAFFKLVLSIEANLKDLRW